jgi:uncharacterized membrane protein YeaQ/YmgE (transglycosylase-associated protein family)
MSVVVYLIALVLSGLVVGALARLALPGKDPLSIPATIGIGLLGSFLAGMVSWAVFGRDVAGIAIAVLFATGIVYLIRRSRGGTLTRAAPVDHLGPGR